MSGRKFAAGDPCFAKVRGWIPYPAKILRRTKNVKKEKYSVLFYGTAESADVEVAKIWSVTAESVNKFMSVSSLSKKAFRAGYEEMKVEHGLIDVIPTGDGNEEDETKTLEISKPDMCGKVCIKATSEIDVDDEFDFNFNYINTVNVDAGSTMGGKYDVSMDGKEDEPQSEKGSVEKVNDAEGTNGDKEDDVTEEVEQEEELVQGLVETAGEPGVVEDKELGRQDWI